MNWLHWILLLLAIIFETVSTAGLKLTDGFTKVLPTVCVFVGYGISFLCFSIAIKTISIGIAYAIWSGLGIALIVLIGWLGFQQKLDAPALVGVALILAGVVIIQTMSKSIEY